MNARWNMRGMFAVVLMLCALNLARADVFLNSSFETGNFTNWTLGGGTWSESSGRLTINNTGNPGKSAVVSGSTTVDPLTDGKLREVFSGDYAARINNSDNSYHFSTLTQTANNWTNDHIYFAWAAVLQEPSNAHTDLAAPHFKLTLTDTTLDKTIYQEAFDVYHPPTGVPWHDGRTDGSGTWKYTDWIIGDLIVTQYFGDSFSLSISAYDCGWGGHGGYAYLDTFQSTIPVANEGVTTFGVVAVPEPGTAAMVLVSLGVAMGGRRFALLMKKRPRCG